MLFGFMFCNFYQSDLHNETCVALANLWIKHQQKNQIELCTSSNLVMVIKIACLLIPKSNIQVLPVVFTIGCGVVNKN